MMRGVQDLSEACRHSLKNRRSIDADEVPYDCKSTQCYARNRYRYSYSGVHKLGPFYREYAQEWAFYVAVSGSQMGSVRSLCRAENAASLRAGTDDFERIPLWSVAECKGPETSCFPCRILDIVASPSSKQVDASL